MPANPPAGDAAPRYTLEIKKEAQKALRKLPRDLLSRLDAAILKLADDPYLPGATKLVGHDLLYRLAVGDWRITYTVCENVLLIVVIEVAPRGSAYRTLYATWQAYKTRRPSTRARLKSASSSISFAAVWLRCWARVAPARPRW